MPRIQVPQYFFFVNVKGDIKKIPIAFEYLQDIINENRIDKLKQIFVNIANTLIIYFATRYTDETNPIFPEIYGNFFVVPTTGPPPSPSHINPFIEVRFPETTDQCFNFIRGLRTLFYLSKTEFDSRQVEITIFNI